MLVGTLINLRDTLRRLHPALFTTIKVANGHELLGRGNQTTLQLCLCHSTNAAPEVWLFVEKTGQDLFSIYGAVRTFYPGGTTQRLGTRPCTVLTDKSTATGATVYSKTLAAVPVLARTLGAEQRTRMSSAFLHAEVIKLQTWHTRLV